MTVKELKEQVAALPEELDNCEVYAYSSIDEGADSPYRVRVYDQKTHENNQGTPYCGGHAPWDIQNGRIVPWEGSPAFVVIG